MTIEIVRVGTDQAPLLRRVAPEVFDDTICPARLQAYLAEPTNRLVVAVAGGEVVGQAAAVLHRHPDRPNELYIDELAVTPAFRRQGIAQRLLAEVIAWGRELDCRDVWIATEDDNEPAKTLYARYAKAVPVAMYQWKLAPPQT